MCDCFEKITKLLTEKCTEKVKDEMGFQEVTDSGFVHQPWLVMDTNMNQRKTAPFYMPFEIKFTRKAKNGNVREYRKTIDFFPSHCPMCGEKYDQSKAG